jgi:hypothetical protein
MDTFSALGYNAFEHGNEHRFIATLPVIRHAGRMCMPVSPGWTVDETMLIDEYEFDAIGVRLPQEIQIDEGMILAVMGPSFQRAVVYLPDSFMITAGGQTIQTDHGYLVFPMNNADFHLLRKRLGDVALASFDTELRERGSVTNALSAYLMMLVNSPAVLLDDRLVRSLLVQKLNGSGQAYSDALALSAQRLDMSQSELEDQVSALIGALT